MPAKDQPTKVSLALATTSMCRNTSCNREHRRISIVTVLGVSVLVITIMYAFVGTFGAICGVAISIAEIVAWRKGNKAWPIKTPAASKPGGINA